MRLAELVEVSNKVAGTSRRLQKTELIADLLRRSSPEEVETAVNYLSGATRQGRTGIGYATLRAAAGAPAQTASLELSEVDRALQDVAGTSGAGSSQRRREALALLFGRATEAEQRFLFGLLTGEIRQGALEGIMVDAIARAAKIPVETVRRAVMMAAQPAEIARVALAEGESALGRYDVQLFRPVQPMLANTAEDVSEALIELGEAALEYKFDGARVQVHRSGDQVRVYSRALNDVTAAVPEVVEAVLAMPARELILDGEVLSFTAGGRPEPFQVTMRRFGRRLDVARMREQQPVQPVWFDLLYLDGGSLIDAAQQQRFAELNKLAPAEFITPHLVTSDAGAAAQFAEAAIAAGHEGVMAKALDSRYAAGSRGQSWLKVKQARTLDLVILAAEWGNGRRQGWLSNLHLGARDTEKGGFAMLGKTFKGLTDEMLAWQTQEFLKIEVARDAYTVFLEPKMVAEIAFNEIQVSPRYASGLALRFARVKRYRPDKTAEAADTFATVKKLAEAQSG